MTTPVKLKDMDADEALKIFEAFVTDKPLQRYFQGAWRDDNAAPLLHRDYSYRIYDPVADTEKALEEAVKYRDEMRTLFEDSRKGWTFWKCYSEERQAEILLHHHRGGEIGRIQFGKLVVLEPSEIKGGAVYPLTDEVRETYAAWRKALDHVKELRKTLRDLRDPAVVEVFD